MEGNVVGTCAILPPEGWSLVEGEMIQEDRWKEIRRLHEEEGVAIAEIARRLELDRKTVRRCLREPFCRRYQRAPRPDTVLAPFAEYVRERAPEVQYSAQILFQELRRRGYRGSYETVKRSVRPMRAVEALAERAALRFETAPGEQSQVDWGTARVLFRNQSVVLRWFVLTLGFSRRSFYEPALNERLPQFLDAHERAFDHLGGHTREHLYDRPRTICAPDGAGSVIWNPTFRSFADYWGFEPRLCRPYRARTKGKVESGVKYLKRNFLPGRRFTDLEDVREQLTQWNTEVADARLHGTTHERPIDRFDREQSHLMPVASRPGFRLEARFARIVADDFLVSLDTNRYSVPFRLIGRTVEVERRDGAVRIFHEGRLVADHPEFDGKHQLRILPEHAPGAIARNARHRRSTLTARRTEPGPLEVEVRDLSTYEALLGTGGTR